MKVLVTDAPSSHTLAIVRYLGKENIDVYTIGSSKFDLARLSKYCKKGFIGPERSKEESYLNNIVDLIRREHFDLLIPVTYKSTKIISEHREQIQKYTKLVLADDEKIKITVNKSSTYALASKLGIPSPKTFYPKSDEDLSAMADCLEYPVVIKPILEMGGGGTAYPKTKSEFLTGYRNLCNKYGFKNNSLPMVQEYIGGDPSTYGCAVLYQKGKCKRIFMHKEVRSMPVTGGAGVYLESFYDPLLKDYSIQLLDSLNWHGVALVEFKKNLLGKYFLMEINAKFWASVEVALRAGCNFPYYLCQISNGSQLPYSEDYSKNLRFHFLNRDIGASRHQYSALPRIICDSLNPKIKSDFWFSDLRPNLVESFSTLIAYLHRNN
jgi:predicted ATP-grasp superfamily ATP-dependent carboligase